MKRLGEGHVSRASHDSCTETSSAPVEERAEVNFDHHAALDSDLLSTHVVNRQRGDTSAKVSCL